MSMQPELSRRQWWALHSFLARIDCDNEEDNVLRASHLDLEERKDLRVLAAEGCIEVRPTSMPGYIRIDVLKRGEAWVERWRKEQLAQCCDTSSHSY